MAASYVQNHVQRNRALRRCSSTQVLRKHGPFAYPGRVGSRGPTFRGFEPSASSLRTRKIIYKTRCCNHLLQTRVPSNGVLGVPTETFEYKLFPAIEFCTEVPRERAEKGIKIFRASQGLTCQFDTVAQTARFAFRNSAC